MEIFGFWVSEEDISIIIRLLLSIVAGGILGHERGQKRRAAGFRTHILVCLSACSIMVTNISMTNQFQLGDPTRMPAQVISGIGFLGAGCILVTDRNRIKGLTTAAALWADACLGLCIGSGCYGIALFSCVAIYLVLTVFRFMDSIMGNKTKYIRLFMEFETAADMSGFIRNSRENGFKVVDLDMISSKKQEYAEVSAVLALQFKKPRNCDDILADCKGQKGVLLVEEV